MSGTSPGSLLALVLDPGLELDVEDLRARFHDPVVDSAQAVAWSAATARAVLVDPGVTVEMSDAGPTAQDRLIDRLPAMTDDPQRRVALAALRPLVMPSRVEPRQDLAARFAEELLAGALATPEDLVDLAPVTDAVTPLFLREILGLHDHLSVEAIIATSRDISIVALADHGLAHGIDDAQAQAASARLDAFDRRLRDAIATISEDADHPLADVVPSAPPPVVAAAIVQVLVGGMDTVSSSICRAILAWVAQGSPIMTQQQVELLWDDSVAAHPPISVMARRTTREVTVAGTAVPRGVPVVVPTRVAVATDDRTGERSLAFGWGEHRCIGRAVARVVATQTLLAIQRSWPGGMSSAVPTGRRFPWVFDGPAHLHVPHPRRPSRQSGHSKGAIDD